MEFLGQYSSFFEYPLTESVQEATMAKLYPTLMQTVLKWQSIIFPPMHPSELFRYENQYELLSLVVLPILCGYMGTHLLFKNLFPLTLLCLKSTIALFCAIWIRHFFVDKQNLFINWFLWH